MGRDITERWGTTPLAERLRPDTFDEYVGQAALAGPDGVLRRQAESGRLRSMILWGPPGVGKTALARILARTAGLPFSTLSAVTSGVKDIRAVAEQVRSADFMGERATTGRVLFIDEIHRFNKAQQDALLPHVEDGTLVLIGSTTENPSFEVNAALLSRVQVFTLEPLDDAALAALLDRALADRVRGFGAFDVRLDDDARTALSRHADGDARSLLNALEASVLDADDPDGDPDGEVSLDVAAVERAIRRRVARHDKSGDRHYDLASAFIKSLRASDADAACYWLGRMIDGGETPRFIARRLVIFASEDVGNADPQALGVAVDAARAVEMVGLPEGSYALYQAACYLATAPKSNASLRAIAAVRELLAEGQLPVPLSLRNAPTTLMKKLGYGDGYRYPHDAPGHIVAGSCLPSQLAGRPVYEPSTFGFEREIRKRIDYWAKLRAERAPEAQEGEDR